jgi:hypothetical protein
MTAIQMRGNIATMNLPKHLPLLLCLIATLATITTTSTRAAAPPAKLIIVSAVYGDLDNDKTLDVLKKLSTMIKDNNLSVAATTQNFGDPAPGAAKKLKVGYTIDGLYHSKTVAQDQVLDISTRLIVINARYGDLPNGPSDDVTQQVADLVRKNTLSVKADNDTFGDPAQNRVKKLTVTYLFDGIKKSKTVAENQTLTISNKGA